MVEAEAEDEAEDEAVAEEAVTEESDGGPMTAEQRELADDEKRLRKLSEKNSAVATPVDTDLAEEFALRRAIMLRKLRHEPPPPGAVAEAPPEFNLWRNDLLVGMGDDAGKLFIRLEGGLYREATPEELRWCKNRISGVDKLLLDSTWTRGLSPNSKPVPPAPIPRDPETGKFLPDGTEGRRVVSNA